MHGQKSLSGSPSSSIVSIMWSHIKYVTFSFLIPGADQFGDNWNEQFMQGIAPHFKHLHRSGNRFKFLLCNSSIVAIIKGINNSACPYTFAYAASGVQAEVSRHKNTTQKTGRVQLGCEYQAPLKIGDWLQFRSR